jgi:hypothetical protein
MTTQPGLMLPALLLALLVAACRPSPAYVPAVETELTVEPVQVRPGDTAWISVAIHNPAPDTVVLDFGDECAVVFAVLDQGDRPLPMADEGSRCLAGEGGQMVLAPGFTSVAGGPWHVPPGVAPGGYVVAAALGDHALVVRGKRDLKMGSGAGRVPLRILPTQGEGGA